MNPKHDDTRRPIPFLQGDEGRIWSAEHCAWWRPRLAGYTHDAKAAGLYSREAFDQIAFGAGPEKRLEFQPVQPAMEVE